MGQYLKYSGTDVKLLIDLTKVTSILDIEISEDGDDKYKRSIAVNLDDGTSIQISNPDGSEYSNWENYLVNAGVQTAEFIGTEKNIVHNSYKNLKNIAYIDKRLLLTKNSFCCASETNEEEYRRIVYKHTPVYQDFYTDLTLDEIYEKL